MDQSITLLLIEDDDEDAFLFQHHLKDAHLYNIIHQKSLNEGIHALENSTSIDLIVLDLGLPDGEGIELIDKLKLKTKLPIIVLTGRENTDDGIDAVQSGAQDYLIKSQIKPNLLIKSIQYTLQRAELQRKIDKSKDLQFAELLNSYVDGVFITTKNHHILYKNEAGEKHLERGNAKDKTKFLWPIEENEEHQIRLKTNNDSNFDLSIRSASVQWQGSPALIIFTKDITEQVKLLELEEEIKEKSKEAEIKDEFLRTVSHEIRTPIAIVSGAISNLEEGFLGELNEKQKQVLQIASRNIKQVNLITINSLQLAKLESGKIELHKNNISISDFFTQLNEDFEIQMQKTGLKFHADNKSSESYLNADENLITQVFHNVITNAIRYAKSTILIEAHDQNNEIEFSVKNDGPLIPQDKLDVIFQSFSQLKQDVSQHAYKGTGLGLNICQKIITLHKGKIWAENTEEGPIFKFTLPKN